MKLRTMGLLLGWILAFGLTMTPLLAGAADTGKQVRSDNWIRWRIDALLQNDNRLDYRSVVVAFKKGEATLTGSVWTDYEKGHATQVAGDVPGVKEVKNQIIVVEPVNADFALMKKVRSQILQETILNVTGLEVNAEAGSIELHGIVSNQKAKDRVAEIVKGIPGVKTIVNDILVEA